MLNSIDRRKGNFKGLLFILGLLIIGLILGYTQHLVNTLQDKSRDYLRFRIRVFEENINNPNANIKLMINTTGQGSSTNDTPSR